MADAVENIVQLDEILWKYFSKVNGLKKGKV